VAVISALMVRAAVRRAASSNSAMHRSNRHIPQTVSAKSLSDEASSCCENQVEFIDEKTQSKV
jgi:hypothetical protein